MNKAIDAFNNLNKAPGVDYSVTVEAIKYGGTDLTNQLLILCNNVKRRRISPRQWRPNLVVPIPKKGDKTKMGNYRGISLMSIAGKLYNRLLLNRIRGPVEAVLLNTQAGFRPGRSCIEHIHVLRRILEGCKDKNIPIIASFVDFKKAFDSIDRDQMFKILRHYGIPDDIVQSIAVLYSNTKSAVLVDGLLSDMFDVVTGVLQGDVLAPFLFIILLDWVIRNSNLDPVGFTTITRRSRRHPEERLSDLGYADDISLLANQASDAQIQIDAISSTAADV